MAAKKKAVEAEVEVEAVEEVEAEVVEVFESDEAFVASFEDERPFVVLDSHTVARLGVEDPSVERR